MRCRFQRPQPTRLRMSPQTVPFATLTRFRSACLCVRNCKGYITPVAQAYCCISASHMDVIELSSEALELGDHIVPHYCNHWARSQSRKQHAWNGRPQAALSHACSGTDTPSPSSLCAVCVPPHPITCFSQEHQRVCLDKEIFL